MTDTKSSTTWVELLRQIYGERAEAAVPMFDSILSSHRTAAPTSERWSHEDAWLIAYPDQFRHPGETPLATLGRFHQAHLAGFLNGVHVLPFYPWSSDDGYSIKDYSAVDPEYGTWADIERLGRQTRVMVDAVVNHMSAQGGWFERWRDGDPSFADFFRTAAPDADLEDVVRAREHPLLTRFETARGSEWVWTTFSADQVDLDYRNPDVLGRVLEVLLDYAARGAAMVRLDAICFLWKEEASPSIHLPETHAVVQFLRACLDETYPDVGLISETNVPHEENITYLGSADTAEAQAVYQFTLPPLVLHSYVSEDASKLGEWAGRLAPPPPGTTFLNFLASHDGVGLRPLEGILAGREIEKLAHLATLHGGRVSSRRLPDGTSSPYEINATWFDLVRGTTDGDDALERHIGSHAIMLAMRGIPAIYVHSLFASSNNVAAVEATGAARSINRERFAPVSTLEKRLADPATRTYRAMSGLREAIRVRRSSPAFHPDSDQEILATPRQVLGVERRSASGHVARVYVNVSSEPVVVQESSPPTLERRASHRDGQLEIGPWGSAWVLG